MKIKCELEWIDIPLKGYTYCEMDIFKMKKVYCRWWIYPIFALGMFLHKKKLHLYHFLNDIGIMKTPEGCIMQLSDIWRR